jgi:hypothetical protein
MKKVRTMAMAAVMVVAGSLPAMAAAVDTSRTYSSGLLIGLFLAFCALLVVVQMIPSIMLLVGFVKGLSRQGESKTVEVSAGPKA